MRIQYRYKSVVFARSVYSGVTTAEQTWTPWSDWPECGLMNLAVGMCDQVETRIVDDNGKVLPQTPPFKPAYYERKPGADGRPAGMTWCTVEPHKDYWIRRDDVSPTLARR